MTSETAAKMTGLGGYTADPGRLGHTVLWAQDNSIIIFFFMSTFFSQISILYVCMYVSMYVCMYINIFKKRWIDWPRRLCPTLCCLALSPGPCLPQFSMTWMNSMDQKIMSWSCFSCLFRLKGYFLSICCEFCLVRVRSVKREFLFDFMQNRRRQNMRKGNDITTDKCTKKNINDTVSAESVALNTMPGMDGEAIFFMGQC